MMQNKTQLDWLLELQYLACDAIRRHPTIIWTGLANINKIREESGRQELSIEEYLLEKGFDVAQSADIIRRAGSKP